MGKKLPRLTTTKNLLSKALLLRPWEKTRKEHWIARSLSGRVQVEVIGDPVRELSLMLPVTVGAGTILGQFVNQYAPGARVWMAAALLTWAENPADHLDVSMDVDNGSVRMQDMLGQIILTVSLT